MKRNQSAHNTASQSGNRPVSLRIDDTIYVGAQMAVDDQDAVVGADNIETQTARAFDNLVASLERAGAGMRELTKLHTYYQYNGSGRAVTDFWERMTKVRLRYLPDPGPAATAVRVSGAPTAAHLIEVDGVAFLSPDRERLMPKHAWDWSIPTPFSQGWRVGTKVLLGGQISADRQGRAIAAGDVREQTKNTLEYIRHVLKDGGANWGDLVTLKICFKSVGHGKQDRELLATIIDEVRRTIPEPRPVLNTFGVDLLYEGLVLEIDGIADRGGKSVIKPAGAETWIQHAGFPIACQTGNEIYIGGLSAPGAASLIAQTEATLDRLQHILRTAGVTNADLAKITIFLVNDEDAGRHAAEYQQVQDTLNAYLDLPGPVVSIVSVPALGHEGQRIMLDGLAVIGGTRTIIN